MNVERATHILLVVIPLELGFRGAQSRRLPFASLLIMLKFLWTLSSYKLGQL